MKKILSILLACCLLAGAVPALAVDARAVIGANLTEEQISAVYSNFGVKRGDVTELRVTNADERKYLEGYVEDSVIGTNSISCVYIEVLEEGEGLDVTTSNINWCTSQMYVSALATAGITDAKIIVAAPFEVSGTAALTGVYMAYEDITGETLDETAKLVSTQELTLTAELAEKIGSYDSVEIVNELKLLLGETKNMTDEQLRREIESIASDLGVSLTDTQISQLISLCRSVMGLWGDGDFQAASFADLWRNGFGMPYEQRNSLVVGFIMGFAVIPVIFTISEDALSNVPPSLIAASEALGAVVLPVASAGIFSALMIGLGRAVGETMIVLMATGNTPIMDWNIFNGMRTLSANIATELPEAAQDSTHYRVLFLGGLILFSMTFILNTLAEIVRQRLRKRFNVV